MLHKIHFKKKALKQFEATNVVQEHGRQIPHGLCTKSKRADQSCLLQLHHPTYFRVATHS